MILERISCGCGLTKSAPPPVTQSRRENEESRHRESHPPSESHVERGALQRLHLLQCPVITDQYHRYLRRPSVTMQKNPRSVNSRLGRGRRRLRERNMTHSGLLDQHVESADTSPVSRRHSVHFVHDEASLRVDLDTGNCRALHDRAPQLILSRRIEHIVCGREGSRQLTWRLPPWRKPSSDVLSMLVEFCADSAPLQGHHCLAVLNIEEDLVVTNSHNS